MSNEVRLAFAAVIEPEIYKAKLALAEYEAVQVRKGDEVVVARGRKVPKGTTGILFWLKDGPYGMRCGVKDADGKAHWTALDNVDLVEPREVDREALAAGAKQQALQQAGVA